LLAVAIVLAASTAAARPDIGLTVKRVGKNLVVENPKIVGLGKAVAAKPTLPGNGKTWHAPLMQPASIEGFEVTADHRITEQFVPGDFVVRHYGTGTGTFEPVEDDTFAALTDKAWEAVAMAPSWIRIEMISNLCNVPADLQDKLADLMLNAADPLWLDEIAFLIANTAPEDLMLPQFRPGYLVDQVRFMYLADPLLDYVTIKDVGTPGDGGDYWSTTVYTYTDEGKEKEWELPKEYYYWWILHSRLDGEELIDIDPATGKYAPYPGGVTFKDFYLFNPDSVEDYMLHYIFRKAPPYEKYKGMDVIPLQTLANWKPSSRGYFPEWKEISPMFLTFDGEGRVTTMEFKVRPKGILLATTLEVERAFADKKSDLLRNMLRYGAGNVVMRPDWKHVVIMEQPPFGKEGVIEGILDEWKVTYEIVDSTWLATADLADVRKIIVPSDQPLAVYQSVSDNRDKLTQWMSEQWRILEIHGAVSDPENDWSGLVMPGGFTGADVAGDGDDTVEVEGQPPMMKYLANTKTIWDLKQYPGLSGDRPCDPDTFALDKIGWWSSQNVFDSAVDFGEKHNWILSPERSSYSVRVLYNHYGNCGENEDVFTSASRTALIAAANSANGPEDHVWTEYYFLDTWHTYQMGWADAPTDIDTPGISSGKKWGGGKNNSFITSARGDGALLNRTDYYTYTGNLTVKVVDANGDPIKGAEVLVATETFYKQDGEYPLTIGFWDITGEDGSVVIQAGANIEEDLAQCKNPEVELRCNNYYLKIITAAGNFPPEQGTVALAVEDIEAVKDFEKEVTVTIEGVPSIRRPTGTQDFEGGNPDRVLRFRVDMLEEMRCGFGLWAGKFCDYGKPGVLDFYLLDQANFVNFMSGEPFKALAGQQDFGPDFEFLVNAPQFGDWYFVVVNNDRFQFEQVLDAHLEALSGKGAVADEPVAVEEADQDVTPAPEDVTLEPDAPQPAADSEGEDTGSGSGGSSSGGCSLAPRAAAPVSLLILLLLFGLFRRTGRRSEI
jgi:hypothetical protein